VVYLYIIPAASAAESDADAAGRSTSRKTLLRERALLSA
jgi:hypothetical protein